MRTEQPPCLLDTAAVAAWLCLSETTLRKWRMEATREGPDWIKCGKAVRYRSADVCSWLAQQTITGGEE